MTPALYNIEKFGEGRVMVSQISRKWLGNIDAVVFDCDGVLIDARESYDSAIARTAVTMVEGFANVKLPLERAAGELIQMIRRTGGFNDDWDTTYALALFSIVAFERSKTKGKPSVSETRRVVRGVSNLVSDFSSKNRLEGRTSVDRYLKRLDLESDLTKELRDYIDQPVDQVHTRMTRTFDEMYYGARLFNQIYRTELSQPQAGLIERERLIITAESLSRLQKLLGVGRIAIATGRPFVSVEYAMRGLLDYFDMDTSIFIGDGDVDPGLAPALREYKKPSGASLVRAYEKLSSKALLYVGDSAEDLLMVKNARKTCDRMLFAGIYGTTPNQSGQIAYFTRNDSDLVARTVETIPEILERTRV